MDALIRLTRHVDYWNRGSRSVVVLEFRQDRVGDGAGNVMQMTPEEWEGLVLIIHRFIAREDTPNYRVFHAPPYGMTTDDLGVVTRFLYHITIIDRERLRFEGIRQ